MKDIKNRAETAFHFVRDKLYSPKNGLIHGRVVAGREHELPTVAEILAAYPNPCGCGTGMEDGMINGGTMLDACLIRYEKEKDEVAALFAKDLVKGMLDCVASAKTEGFVPRGVSIEDQKSHYPDASVDQYTMFAFGMHRYLNSVLCKPAERARIAALAVGIARRAERNVTKENGYDMLTDDGGPTMTTVLWGEARGNHEYLRLPMLYLLAYEASGDRHWFEKYCDIREEAYARSLPMGRYWAMYALQQMQASIVLCYDVDDDAVWRERYAILMNHVADYAEEMVDEVRRKMENYHNFNAPQIPFRDLPMSPAQAFINLGYSDALTVVCPDMEEFFKLQNCAQLMIITKMVPHRRLNEQVIALFADAFEKIDFSVHERDLPVHFVDAYYRSLL